MTVRKCPECDGSGKVVRREETFRWRRINDEVSLDKFGEGEEYGKFRIVTCNLCGEAVNGY